MQVVLNSEKTHTLCVLTPEKYEWKEKLFWSEAERGTREHMGMLRKARQFFGKAAFNANGMYDSAIYGKSFHHNSWTTYGSYHNGYGPHQIRKYYWLSHLENPQWCDRLFCNFIWHFIPDLISQLVREIIQCSLSISNRLISRVYYFFVWIVINIYKYIIYWLV